MPLITSYLITVITPKKTAEAVKKAIFSCGAGQLGHYQEACWETSGYGQFVARSGSNPHIGKVNEVTTVEEIKIEVLCEKEKIELTVASIVKAHPYEHPSITVTQIQAFNPL